MANSDFPLFDRRPKRKLAAILAADVVGFSKMMGENEDRTLINLKACREITDGAIREHHGRVFGTAGDSVIAEFASPVDAILAAVEFQKNLLDRNAVVSPENRMQFRVGLNLGDVIVEGDNLFGDGVNVAARLEPLAKPGGICISGKFHDEVHRKLELLFENVGPREVKNIENPVQTYHVVFDQNLENIVASKFNKNEEKKEEKNPQDEFDQDKEKTIASEDAKIEWGKPALLKDKKPRIIILPFQNSNNNEDNEFLVDGIVEDIITEFSRLNSIEIISRNSAFSYKGKRVDNTHLATEFGINYIVTGSIRSAGNRIRITVELTDPNSVNSIWSERYDRTLDDVFEVQDEIVRKVIIALVGRLEIVGLERAKRKPTEDLSSYEYLLRGRDFHHKFSKNGVLSAIEMLDKSIAADPNNAQAYAWRACSIGQGWGNGYLEGEMEDPFEEIKRMVQKASEIDENDFECNRLMCEINKLFEDFEKSEYHGKKAFEMNPNDPRILNALGDLYVLTNRANDGIALLLKAYELDPIGLGASNADKRLGDIMFGAYVSGDYDMCLEYDKKIGSKTPKAWASKIASLSALGKTGEKSEELKRFKDSYPEIVLENEIEKIHFQDANVKNNFKELVI